MARVSADTFTEVDRRGISLNLPRYPGEGQSRHDYLVRMTRGHQRLQANRGERIRVLHGVDFDPDELADDIEILLDETR